MQFKLGLKPASFNPNARFLADYLDRGAAPPQPKPIDMSIYAKDHPYVMTAIMANGPDPLAPMKIAPFGVGDCFWAAAVRFAALTALSKGVVLFRNEEDMVRSALDGYHSTGWDINQTDSAGNNPTDNGTDPTQGFTFLEKVGLFTSDGTRHKFGPQLQINPKDWVEVMTAFEIAEGIMIGINFPMQWETDKIWTLTNSPISGGHEIPAYSNENLGMAGIEIDTWGNAAPGPRIITPSGLAQQCTQLTAIINPAEFKRRNKTKNGRRKKGGKNVEGFNSAQWLADIGV